MQVCFTEKLVAMEITMETHYELIYHGNLVSNVERAVTIASVLPIAKKAIAMETITIVTVIIKTCVYHQEFYESYNIMKTKDLSYQGNHMILWHKVCQGNH